MHPNGTVAIMDRSKDIIISGGEASAQVIETRKIINPKFFDRTHLPSPLNKVSTYLGSLLQFTDRFAFLHPELSSHPHVLEVSVVARPHVKWGERPMAFVVLHPQHESRWKARHAAFAADLKEHAKSRLPGFACPEWVEVVPELPVSIFVFVFLSV